MKPGAFTCLYCLEHVYPRPRYDGIVECLTCGCLYSMELVENRVDEWEDIAFGRAPGFHVERHNTKPPYATVTRI